MGRTYYKLMASFLSLIIVCCLAFGIYSYNSVMKDAKKRAIASNEILLNICKSTLDSAISDLVNNFIQNALVIETFDGLLLPKPNSADYLSQKKNINLNQFVVHLGAGSQILDSVMIYYKDEGVFLTSNGRFSEEGFWAEKIVRDIKHKTTNTAWVGPLYIKSYATSRNIWGLSYIRQLPLITSYKKAAFIGNIDLTKLSDQVSAFEDKYHGQKVYAVNQDGIVIVDRDKKLIGKDISVLPYMREALGSKSSGYVFTKDEYNGNILVSYVQSDLTPWRYIIITPVDSLVSSSMSIINGTIYMCIALTGIGIFLSTILSKKLYKPVQSLLGILDKQSFNRKRMYDEYEMINDFLKTLEKDNKHLHSQVQNVLQIVKERLLLDILKDYTENRGNVDYILKDYGLNIPFKNYIVIAIVIDNKDAIDSFGRSLCLFSMKNITDELITRQYAGFVTSEDNTVLALVDFNQPDYYLNYKQTAEYLCTQIRDNIEKLIGPGVSIGISQCYTTIEQLSNAYAEAREALKYRSISEERSLIFIEDVDGREQVVETYPYELGKELIKNIKNIDADKSNDIIKQIMDFLRKSAFSYQHARQFLIQLFGMVIMAIKDMGYEVSEVFGERSLYREMEQQEDIEDMYEWINSICNDVITFLNNARKSQSKDIARLAKEYIDHQLTDVDLSLASVAESLYVSDSYLSRIFKEELGVNFFDYITQQRIKKAKELLATTDMNVNEIAAGVGMSVQSFIRNFKKYEGITPGKYREKFNLDKDVNSIL